MFCIASMPLPCAHAQQSEADRQALAQLRARAERGDAESQFELGTVFSLGKLGVPTNYVEAVKWFRQSADQNNAAAQQSLGACYERGEGVAKDEAEAVKWWRKAAEQNYAWAQFNLGNCYRTGQGVVKNEAEAVKWYRQAADQNDSRAQYSLGKCYREGVGVAKDEAEARKWYSQAAERDNPWAQYELGICYAMGLGVARDYVEAYKWLLLAGAQKDGLAREATPKLERQLTRRQLAEGQKRASEFKPPEPASLDAQQGEANGKPPAELRAKPATGDALAPKASGEALPAGKGGSAKDNAEKVKWFPHPDNRNEPSGDRAKDEAEASRWYLLALRVDATAGKAEAQNALGEAFYAGKQGVAKNAVEAVKWFRTAAEQNLSAAQSNLGVCYERGDGVAKYETEAYKWYLLAATQGDTKAKRNATLLELLLSSEETAEGKRRAQDWLEQQKKATTKNR